MDDQSPSRGQKLKTMILGDTAVGKTSIIRRFITGTFPKERKVSLAIKLEERIVNDEGNSLQIQMWDTAGQDIFKSIIKCVLMETVCVFLIYSINDKKSFAKVKFWLKEARHVLREDCIFVLIGNKSDLPRDVSFEKGFKFMQKNQLDLFFELSAKTGENFDESFLQVVQQLGRKVNTSRSYQESIEKNQKLDETHNYCGCLNFFN